MDTNKITFNLIITFLSIALLFNACKKDDDITTTPNNTNTNPPAEVVINPVDIDVHGGEELLEKMQGHWTGSNKVLSWEWDWFAFDYRAISESHVFGIYEGGSMGNLFTSFYIADFEGTKTIMARNGGVLSGIYRTSYFILDSLNTEHNFYRLVDGVGGKNTMYMELRFSGDSLYWNAYTSRLGENSLPSLHFSFKAQKENSLLANNAASIVNFPSNNITWDFSDGFYEEYLYVIDGEEEAKSASFLSEGSTNDVYSLAAISGDPYTISDHPYLSTLNISLVKQNEIINDNIIIYLSTESLTDQNGYLITNAFNSIVQFPEISSNESNFLFTYLHPGDYYITVIADKDNDGVPGFGDYYNPSTAITIAPESNQQITIDNINITSK